MALEKCSECGGKVSSSAAACPHCGAAVKKKSGFGPLFMLGLLVLIAIAIAGNSGSSTSEPKKESRTLKISIVVSSAQLKITNLGSADWSEAVVYINGTPPFTYKQRASAPRVGESISLNLIEFVNKEGDRFNPLTKAVREVWVGGSGYDYQQYNVSR